MPAVCEHDVSEENPVRVIDVFVDEISFVGCESDGVPLNHGKAAIVAIEDCSVSGPAADLDEPGTLIISKNRFT